MKNALEGAKLHLPIKHDITFSCEEKEMLRLCEDGQIIIRGEKVATNVEAYKAFIDWMNMLQATRLTL